MTPERWERVKSLFAEALDVNPAKREQYVRDAAAGDVDLYREVLSLLAADSDRTVLRSPLATREPTPAPEAGVPPGPAVGRRNERSEHARPVSGDPRPGWWPPRLEPELEAAYSVDHFRRSLTHVRGAILLAIGLYAAFGLLDARVAPDQTRLLFIIRFAIVCPAAALVFLYSYSPSFSRHWQPLLAGLVLVGAAGIVVMIASIPEPGSYLYSSGLLLLTFYYATLLRLSFRYALALSVVVLALYNAVVFNAFVPGLAILTNNMMLVAGGIIALTANLMLERHSRREFLQQREIASRTAALEARNRELAAANLELLRSREAIAASAEKNDLLFAALTEALPGTVLDGKYRLEEQIGAGGFGTVYRAFHLQLRRPVAVKLLKPSGGDLGADIAHFRREGINASRLNHPNAVHVLDFGVAAGRVAYLVMELLNGRSLAQEIAERGPLSLERCREIVLPLCAVLKTAHASGIVHRDLKPSNVFLHRNGAAEVVKIIDFGLAKDLAATQTTGAASLTRLAGTPGYIAPERWLEGASDWRADVFALAVMVYEMLTAERPIQPESRAGWSEFVAQSPGPGVLTSLRDRNARVPRRIDALVTRGLAADPGLRPTAEEFEVAFAAMTDHRGPSRRATSSSPAPQASGPGHGSDPRS
jgi:hypothetical protein